MSDDLPSVVRIVDHDLETKELIDKFKTARRAKAQWEELEDELREKLIKLFGVDHHGHWQATAHNRTILKIDSTPVRRFDTTAFKSDHPDLYESYKAEITFTKVVTAGTADVVEVELS